MADTPRLPQIDMKTLFGGLNVVPPSLDSLDELNDAIAAANFAKSAGGVAEHLFAHIEAFEASLDANHEVGVRLVSFGQSVTFQVADIGYTQPHMIWFRGVLEDGSPVQLIQHMSQLSFLLTSLPRAKPEEPRRPIGFHHPSADAGGPA